jgi:hypothetical protein
MIFNNKIRGVSNNKIEIFNSSKLSFNIKKNKCNSIDFIILVSLHTITNDNKNKFLNIRINNDLISLLKQKE